MELVWHGVNDEVNLREFLSSMVRWGECDVRRDPRQRLILRHDSFERTPWTRAEPLLPLATALEAFAGHGRGVKLDLKDGPGVLDEVLALLDRHGFDDDHLWFDPHRGSRRPGIPPVAVSAAGRHDAVPGRLPGAPGGSGTEPGSDGAAPAGRLGDQPLLRGLGRQRTRSLVGSSEEWGYEVNLYAVPDHESFLQAVLLLPRSLTADFNFRGGTTTGGARVSGAGTTAIGSASRHRLPEGTHPRRAASIL